MTLYDGSTLIFFLDFTVPRSQGRWNCVYIAVIILANYFVPGVKKMWCFARPIADSFQSRCWQSSHVSTCPWGLLVPVRSAYKRIAPVNPMKSCCSGLSSLFFLERGCDVFFTVDRRFDMLWECQIIAALWFLSATVFRWIYHPSASRKLFEYSSPWPASNSSDTTEQ
jgi:hypothetical protein